MFEGERVGQSGGRKQKVSGRPDVGEKTGKKGVGDEGGQVVGGGLPDLGGTKGERIHSTATGSERDWEVWIDESLGGWIETLVERDDCADGCQSEVV